MMAWPMGLPDWEVTKHAIEDTEQLDGTEVELVFLVVVAFYLSHDNTAWQASKHTMPEDGCFLWFAGKQVPSY